MYLMYGWWQGYKRSQAGGGYFPSFPGHMKDSRTHAKLRILALLSSVAQFVLYLSHTPDQNGVCIPVSRADLKFEQITRT